MNMRENIAEGTYKSYIINGFIHKSIKSSEFVWVMHSYWNVEGNHTEYLGCKEENILRIFDQKPMKHIKTLSKMKFKLFAQLCVLFICVNSLFPLHEGLWGDVSYKTLSKIWLNLVNPLFSKRYFSMILTNNWDYTIFLFDFET